MFIPGRLGGVENNIRIGAITTGGKKDIRQDDRDIRRFILFGESKEPVPVLEATKVLVEQANGVETIAQAEQSGTRKRSSIL